MATTITGIFLDQESYTDPVKSGAITVSKEGYIANTNGLNGSSGLFLSGGAHTLTVLGSVASLQPGGVGVFVTAAPGAMSKITIGAEGAVTASSGFGLSLDHDVTLKNSGYLGGDQGVFVSTNGKGSTITNGGLIGSISGKEAILLSGGTKNTITNTGTIAGKIWLDNGAGTNIVSNSGIIEGAFDAANSSGVTFTNKGLWQHGGDFTVSGGNDSVTNSGRILGGTNVNLANGNDKLTNSGLIDSKVEFSTGNDTLTNSGTIEGNADMGDDNDTVTNSGKIDGDALMGLGNDKLTNTGTISGVIEMGAGDDIFVGGKQAETVADDAGKDDYKLGDGLDEFVAYDGINSGAGADDNVDGGTNTGSISQYDFYGDLYDASNTTSQVKINLDSKVQTNVVDGNVLVDAGKATGTQIGTDYIKGFEMAYGGSGDDWIFGSSANNLIEGNVGADRLFGGAGNDRINGGSGGDFIVGGLGRDLMEGGDASTDFFIYTSVKDSTVAFAGRDMIEDFVSGEDEIDLTRLIVPIDFRAQGSFTATGAAEVRYVQTGIGVIVQVDINGDGKTDMAIDLLGVTSLVATDFEFAV